jgi:SAM-dependent methyltransferase
MHLDATELRDFYARPLGAMVRRLLTHRIRARWGRLNGRTLIGLGYATPYLGAFRGEAIRIGAFMPVAQGAVVWPPSHQTLSVLVEEERLPLADNTVDRLLVVHCLEATGRPRPLLRELWRVLSPEGRLLMIVPNRSGLWARTEVTPFGQGQPYSRGQLDRLLNDAMLTPLDWSWALHVPPVERPIVLQSALAFERAGARVWRGFGGVIIVEAKKELLAPMGRLRTARALGGLITVPGR